MDIALNGFKSTGMWPCNRHEFDDDDFYAPTLVIEDSLRTPPLDINNQEELSAVVTQESKETHEEETDAPINQIKLQLNILAPIPIINQSKEFRGCPTSSRPWHIKKRK